MQKDQFKGTVKETKEKIKEVTPEVIDDKGLQYEDRVEHQTGKVEVRHGDATRGSAKSEKAIDQGYGRS